MAVQRLEQFKSQPRLPKFAIPKRYDLKLKPDLSSCKFTGFVRIDLQIVSETRFIVLNAADLSFKNSSICFTDRRSNKEYRPSEFAMVEEDDILVLQFDDGLSPGEGVLLIGFSGTLNDQMKGFYRSTYEHNGEKKNMAVTQFEPADARRCFPCWDEPAVKAWKRSVPFLLSVFFNGRLFLGFTNWNVLTRQTDLGFGTEQKPCAVVW